MQHYLKPTKREFNPDIFILHVGTNSLSTNDSPEMIADKIAAQSLRTENNNVVLSAIVSISDKLNKILEKSCNQKQIGLIKHSNINIKRHMNRSRLHLNGCKKSIFMRNIRNNLKDFK